MFTSSFDYDAIGQLTGAAVPDLAGVTRKYAYGYDKAGNRTEEQADTALTTSVHNNLNQLTSQAPGGLMEFAGTVDEPATVSIGGRAATVDGAKNWSGKAQVAVGANAIPLVATDVNGNSTNKTINVTVSGGAARTLVYDAAGNEVDNGAGQTYTYDAVNRLRTITQGSDVTEFVYNGQGQRVQEKLNGTLIKQWIWDGGPQPAEERDASNVVTKRFFGGMGEQIAGTNYYYTTDHLGSVREMTDATGTIRARYDYDPYGRQTKVSGDLESDFGFTGFYRHQTSGLNLTFFRAYDPELGRWTSRDPIGENGGLNLYAYVGNRPISGLDALGLKVRYSDDLTPADRKMILAQNIFLSHSPAFQAAWRAIVQSNVEFVLTRDRSTTSSGRFIPGLEVAFIRYDLDVGLDTGDGNCVLPVQTTAHEIGHAADLVRVGFRAFVEMIDSNLPSNVAPYVPHAADLSALMFERTVSKELGLFSNMNYSTDPDYKSKIMPYLPGEKNLDE